MATAAEGVDRGRVIQNEPDNFGRVAAGARRGTQSGARQVSEHGWAGKFDRGIEAPNQDVGVKRFVRLHRASGRVTEVLQGGVIPCGEGLGEQRR